MRMPRVRIAIPTRNKYLLALAVQVNAPLLGVDQLAPRVPMPVGVKTA